MLARRTVSPVPKDFFGMHINKVASSQPINVQTPWCEVGQAWHRIWDNYCSWKQINTASGVYDWSRMDDVIAIATAHGKKLIMCIGCAPDWATGGSTGSSQYSPFVPTDAAVIAWATAWATHCKGKVHAAELWNEPSAGQFWAGTPAQLAHICALMYAIIKAIDPGMIVVSPSCPGVVSIPWFNNLLAAGMADSCDVIGFHAYTAGQPPEHISYLVENYQGVLRARGIAKPLWNTEYGWLSYLNAAGQMVATNTSADVMTDQQGSAYVSRSCLILASCNLAGSIYYSADGQADNSWLMKPTFLDYPTRSIKQPAARAFEYAAKLLPGGWVRKPAHNGSYYTLKGQSGASEKFSALWCRDWTTATVSASAMGATRVTDCRGVDLVIAADTINLSMEPTFIFR
jgi:hypothetical protein